MKRYTTFLFAILALCAFALFSCAGERQTYTIPVQGEYFDGHAGEPRRYQGSLTYAWPVDSPKLGEAPYDVVFRANGLGADTGKGYRFFGYGNQFLLGMPIPFVAYGAGEQPAFEGLLNVPVPQPDGSGQFVIRPVQSTLISASLR